MARLYSLILFLVLSFPLFAQVKLDQMMSRKEMQNTGVDTLNYSQKTALEEWLNDRFVAREGAEIQSGNELFLSLNIDEGAYLELSDGSTYEIDPDDRVYSAFWITPFPVLLSESNNPDYPIKITNLNSNTAVNGREVSTRQLLKEEKLKHAQKPQPTQPDRLPPQPDKSPTQPKKPPQPKTTPPKETPSQ